MVRKKELDDFIRDYKLDRESGILVITTKDLSPLRSAGYSVEDLLDHVCRHYKSLLHGSRVDICDDHLKPGKRKEVYGTNLAAIALLKAVISNQSPVKLKYPYFISQERRLEVKIENMGRDTIGNHGFVYVLNQTEGFENGPIGSWQYVKMSGVVPVSAKIMVLKSDFAYPIFDVTNNRKIQ